MGDAGRWWKLWTTAPTDEKLADLSLEDFARWCLFGIYLKTHGTQGTIVLSPPCKTLCDWFRVRDFAGVLSVIAQFPNCTVTGVTTVTVTSRNWSKYQGDFSGDRVRKYRAHVTAKKRREERRIPPTPLTVNDQGKNGFESFWAAYPRKVAKGEAGKAWESIKPDEATTVAMALALSWQKLQPDWTRDLGKFIPYPATWLRAKRWLDEQPPKAKPMGEWP